MTSINSIETLGAMLRGARKQQGLTQSDLASAAGVGLRFVVELEAGKPSVRLAQALRVIATLGGQMEVSGLPDRGRHGA